jgi:hypothetical protein
LQAGGHSAAAAAGGVLEDDCEEDSGSGREEVEAGRDVEVPTLPGDDVFPAFPNESANTGRFSIP